MAATAMAAGCASCNQSRAPQEMLCGKLAAAPSGRRRLQGGRRRRRRHAGGSPRGASTAQLRRRGSSLLRLPAACRHLGRLAPPRQPVFAWHVQGNQRLLQHQPAPEPLRTPEGSLPHLSPGLAGSHCQMIGRTAKGAAPGKARVSGMQSACDDDVSRSRLLAAQAGRMVDASGLAAFAATCIKPRHSHMGILGRPTPASAPANAPNPRLHAHRRACKAAHRPCSASLRASNSMELQWEGRRYRWEIQVRPAETRQRGEASQRRGRH